MSKKLFCSCSLKVAARIRHNKVLFVLHHTMSTMFLVALLVQSFPGQKKEKDHVSRQLPCLLQFKAIQS